MDGFDIDQGELVLPKDRPNLTFEEGSFTLPELLESHLLPVVAQYDVTRQPIPFNEFNFDLSQPLLLYKKRNIQKVVARSLHIEGEKYNEVGESLLIPEDYKGWFAVLQRITGNIKADDTVPHFATVEEVANSNTDRFLIGGTKKISGLQLLDRSEPQLKHEQRQFLPGDILTREKIYYGETRKRTRLFRKPKYITEKFLMCRDESDREILLPFEQTGIFYQISHKSGKPSKQVMQMSDIVARKLTPRIIKLVFGRFPVTPCSFTGIMRAESSKIETSIIASTLINTKNILMEIPVSSAIHFRVAVMNNELRTNVCYRNAMSICAERAITYMRNIKVCYNFTMDDEDGDILSSRDTDMQTSSCAVNNNINNNLTTFKQNNGDKNLNSKNTDSNTDILRNISTTGVRNEGRRGFSVDIPDDITVRPGRCHSTGRVSFCLGNNYLTVPMFEHGHIAKRDSGNNNTIHEMTFTTKSGSRLSFNGTFFEEVEEENENDDTTTDKDGTFNIPPPLPCTNINSYVNIVSPPQISADSENPDYIPAAGVRRPSTQPPDTAPPPLPRSSSTSGVSSGSLSSVSDETLSKRESSDSFEYAVPKSQDSNKLVSNVTEIPPIPDSRPEKPLMRRPSTFTFSEGCCGLSGKGFKLPLGKSVDDIAETSSDDGSPIYENIQKLMELVSKIDSDRQSGADEYTMDEDIDGQTQEKADDEDCSREAVNTECNANEKGCSETVTNETENQTRVSEGSPDTECQENSMKSNFETSVSREENMSNLNDSDQEKSTGENIVEKKVRRIGVTEREYDDIQLDNYCENKIQDPEISDNIENNEEHEDNGLNEITKYFENFVEQIASEENNSDASVPGDISRAEVFLTEEKPSHNEAENGNNTEGLCRWKIAVEKMKNSHEHMVSKSKIREVEKPISDLSVDEIAEELASIGIKEGTIEHIKEMGVDGAKLSEVLEGDLSIRDCLDGVNLVDQQKISMFLRGWRPNSE